MNLQTTLRSTVTPNWRAVGAAANPLVGDEASLIVGWASCEADVRQAQALRYQVFAEEMDASLSPLPGTVPGLDSDRFDAFCDHLLVWARGAEDGCEVLVGTYRLLPHEAAQRAGGLYIDTEFDITSLDGLRSTAVELGRSCVHPDWRSGGVIMALWAALAQYMMQHGLDTMIGCASVGLGDGGRSAARLWHGLRHSHLAAAPWHATPQRPLPLAHHTIDDLGPASVLRDIRTPPLVRGYLRCGARLLGPPALDLAFNTADFPLMLRIADLEPRYRRHFLGA
jgi:putative hemolysin